jgi:hypothetical protein
MWNDESWKWIFYWVDTIASYNDEEKTLTKNEIDDHFIQQKKMNIEDENVLCIIWVDLNIV